MVMKIADPKVAAAFNGFPPVIRRKLMRLRMLIFDGAYETEGGGELEVILKWGQPSYLTKKSKCGNQKHRQHNNTGSASLNLYFEARNRRQAGGMRMAPGRGRGHLCWEPLIFKHTF